MTRTPSSPATIPPHHIDSIDEEVSRLVFAGVEFTGEISDHPWWRIAVFKDFEGNDLQFDAPPA